MFDHFFFHFSQRLPDPHTLSNYPTLCSFSKKQTKTQYSAVSAGSGGAALLEEALFEGQVGCYVAPSSFQVILWLLELCLSAPFLGGLCLAAPAMIDYNHPPKL